MKSGSTRTRRIAGVIAMGLVAATWTIRGASPAEAVIAIIRQTGNFSLARGQATSAHVVNTGEERGFVVDWRVLDSQGNTLGQSDRRLLEPGQASSFDFIPNDGDFGESQRLAIHLILMVEGASRSKAGLIATQEVYNIDDGKTTVFLPYIEQ